MALFDTHKITSVANSDNEFRLTARLWNADLRLEVGADAYLLRMRDGHISEFSKTESRGYDVKISAPEGDWRELLKPIPKPFYQDLMAGLRNAIGRRSLAGFSEKFRRRYGEAA